MHTDYSLLPLNNAYAGRIGNECLWLIQAARGGFQKLSQQFKGEHSNFIDSVNANSEQFMYKISIVYIVNLMESFMKDFICYKEGLTNAEDDKSAFEQIKASQDAAFSTYISGLQINNSKSFMNLHYSLFFLKNKYGVHFTVRHPEAMRELGSLRNCIVHSDEKLSKKDKGGLLFSQTMPNTLELLPQDNDKITDYNHGRFTEIVIEDMQAFLGSITL
ncbi:hypothetical protein ACTJIJ_14970 [Niabella sp. 22666]|uniref:hypothetical protein n=1 Tax=Niabella sp. 22666 TaxID=3453954 RepID=UPI003F84EF1C